jgi:tmRNA-binding protein
MIDNKEIKQFISSARNDNAASFDMVEKHSFSLLLSGIKIKLINKLIKNDSGEVKDQIASIDRMENFLERLTFKNCVFHFQAKTILSQDRRIILLEQEKKDLIKRSSSKIKELEGENSSLSNELTNVKKRIKNDKESS